MGWAKLFVREMDQGRIDHRVAHYLIRVFGQMLFTIRKRAGTDTAGSSGSQAAVVGSAIPCGSLGTTSRG